MSPYLFNVYQEYPTKVVTIFGEFAIGTNGGISPILTNAGDWDDGDVFLSPLGICHGDTESKIIEEFFWLVVGLPL